uniref:Uncharacterized protein n=1 Tax=Picea glauca TaxID=3330 RepID=A0A101M469_PICGL|nr:hypothetical protein ABT39_MTgene600 [Picea glauca]
MTRNCFIASTPIPINLAPASCSKFTLYRLTRVKAYSCYCLPSSLLFTYPQYYYCYFLPSFPTIAIAYKKDYCLPAFALLLLCYFRPSFQALPSTIYSHWWNREKKP